MPYCAVYGCKKNQKDAKKANIKFYTFPKDPTVQKEWEKACRRNKPVNAKNARICSLHFSQDSFQRRLIETLLDYAPANSRNLKPDAIPTENLPNEAELKKVPKPKQSSKRRTLPDESIYNIGKKLKPKQSSKRKIVNRKRRALARCSKTVYDTSNEDDDNYGGGDDSTSVIDDPTGVADRTISFNVSEKDREYISDTPSRCTEDTSFSSNTNTHESIREPEAKNLTSSDAKWKTEVGILCRLCMRSDFNCVPIFRGKGEKMELETKITEYLQLKISSSDVLPDQVCPLCFDAIIAWDEYAMSCIDVERKLYELLTAEDEVPYPLITSKKSCVSKENNSTSLIKNNSASLKEDNPVGLQDNNSVGLDEINEASVSESNKLLNFWTCENYGAENNYLVLLMGNTTTQIPSNIGKSNPVGTANTISQHVLSLSDEDFCHSDRGGSFTDDGNQNTEEMSDSNQNYTDNNDKQNDTTNNLSLEPVVMSDGILGSDQEAPERNKTQNLQIINASNENNTPEKRGICQYTLCLTPFLNSVAQTNDTETTDGKNVSLEEIYMPDNESQSASESNVFYEDIADFNFQGDVISEGCYLPIKGETDTSGLVFRIVPNVHNYGKAPHPTIIHRCVDCPMTFSNIQDLKDHKLREHRKIGLKNCPVCHEDVKTSDFKIHLNSHPGACKFCYEIIPDDDEYQHKLTHLKYICDICGRKFFYRHTLRVHLDIHSIPDKLSEYKCEECNTVFKWKAGFYRHNMRKHSDVVTVKCNICDKEFYPWFIKQHMKTVHSVNRPFNCDLCGKNFKNKKNIRHHMESHLHISVKRKINKSIQCIKCGMFFASNVGLTLHARVDCSSSRMCSICGMFMETLAKYNRHMSTRHKSMSFRYKCSKNFKCKYCPMSFNSNHVLTIHERRHTGERPFSCYLCDKTFTSKHVLDAHTSVHSTIKPFFCGYCNKSFSHKKNLSAHVQIHFPREPSKCPICSRHFINPKDFRRHFKRHNE